MDATPQDPLIGQVVDGRYRVLARIAVGGMATVYRALDTRLDRTLALKVMHASLSTDTAFVERFIREAKTAARLSHPNVVGVTDQSSDGDHVYLAMEYVGGGTLRDLVRDGALQPRAVLDLLEPVLAGLAAAHRAGLVHRDVKPENVLIGDDGRIKVADFGLVRGVHTHSADTETLLGTTSYLAPEQIDTGEVGPATDVYACGIVLYELLTGTKPHAGDSTAQVLMAHVNRDVPPPSAAVPTVPAALDQLVARATARQVNQRPTDAAALLAEVRTTRARLSETELDARPAGGAAAVGAEDVTQVVTRGSVAADAGGPEPTTVLTPPARSSGAARGGPVGGGEPEDREETTVRRYRTRSGAGAVLRGLPRRQRAASMTGAVLVLVAAAVGLWYISSGQFLQTPGVYDLPQEEAVGILEDEGLRVEVAETFSPNVAAGHVVTTEPERGDRIRRNGTVTIAVSQGPEVVTVPDVAGESLERAREELTTAGLTPGDEDAEFHDEVPRGSVIGTDPEAGEERRPDSPVRLTVSRGVEVRVPDVVGSEHADAEETLEDAGFEVRTEQERVHSTHEAGEVAAMSPEAGDSAGAGETVTLTISRGPEMIVVPDVRGMEESDAREELEDAGFEVEVQRWFLTSTVFNQSVHSGDRAPEGSTITIYLR